MSSIYTKMQLSPINMLSINLWNVELLFRRPNTMNRYSKSQKVLSLQTFQYPLYSLESDDRPVANQSLRIPSS